MCKSCYCCDTQLCEGCDFLANNFACNTVLTTISGTFYLENLLLNKLSKYGSSCEEIIYNFIKENNSTCKCYYYYCRLVLCKLDINLNDEKTHDYYTNSMMYFLLLKFGNPMNKINNRIINLAKCNFENFFKQAYLDCTTWIQKNVKLGAIGQAIALEYLKHYSEVATDVSTDDSLGYDIEYYNNKIEVKTSTTNLIHFTDRQINKATEFGDNYFLFYIYVNRINATIDGFLLQNPVEIFDLHNYNNINIFNNTNVKVMLDGLKIYLNTKWLKEQYTPINLNRFLQI